MQNILRSNALRIQKIIKYIVRSLKITKLTFTSDLSGLRCEYFQWSLLIQIPLKQAVSE